MTLNIFRNLNKKMVSKIRYRKCNHMTRMLIPGNFSEKITTRMSIYNEQSVFSRYELKSLNFK